MTLAAIPFGLAIGLAVGALGGGGSVLAVPVLVYVLGQSVQDATTASLVVVTAGALAGGLAHHRSGRVCWRHAALFTAAALPGIVAGTVAGGGVRGSMLLALFALLMLGAAIGSWRRAVRGKDESETACPPLRPRRDIVAGVVIGFATGFFGVGGGFLVVPTLAMALAFSMRPAVGTSLVIVTLTSSFGLAAHLLAGRGIDVSLTGAMAAACAFGAFAGAAAVGRLPVEHLRRGFAGLVALVALYLLVSAVAFGGPAGG